MTIRIIAAIAFLFVGFAKVQATSIPFRILKKSILIEATINDVSGYFLLDTGTPYLVLNSDFFTGGTPSGKTITGLHGGQTDIYEKKVNLSIGNFEWDWVNATLLPLDHLSRIKDVTIMGLIGTSLLNRFELTIDFDALELELVRVNKRSVPETSGLLPDASFRFIWRGGIPVIKTKIGNSSLFFGFDTGAGINVLDEKKGEQVAAHLTIDDKIRVSGMGKGGRSLQSGLIHNVIIENYYCPEMNVVLAPLARFKGIDSQMNMVDGFLGYEFIKHFKTIINFRNGTISIYHRDGQAENYIVAR